MSPNAKSIIKYSLTFVVALAIFWFIFNKIDLQDMLGKIRTADFKWVGFALIASVLSHVSRAWRWKILIEPLGYKPSLGNTFMAVMVGYFANLVAPRMGEVSRCVILTKNEKIPFNSSFGTVVAERAFDLLCLLFLLGLAFLLEIEKFGEFFRMYLMPGRNAYYLLSGAFFVFLIVAIVIYNYRTLFLKSPFISKVSEFLLGVWKGVLSIGKIKRKAGFFLHTAIIWTLYFLMTYLVFFSLEATADLTVTAGVLILVVGSLGMSAPVQGGIGVFHQLVATGLLLFYAIPESDGLAFAFVLHTSQTLLVIFLGAACLIASLLKSRNEKVMEKKKLSNA